MKRHISYMRAQHYFVKCHSEADRIRLGESSVKYNKFINLIIYEYMYLKYVYLIHEGSILF